METEPWSDDQLDETCAGDDRLARLLWEYVNRLNSGEELDAGRIREEHPDVAWIDHHHDSKHKKG